MPDPTDGVSYFFKVHIDPAGGVANLEPLPNGMVPYNQVDAMACDAGRVHYPLRR